MGKKEIAKRLGFEAFNTMQTTVFEASEKHNNLVVYSSTGSGKTVAFLLPLIEKLQPQSGAIQAIIITPARELALQIEKVFKSFQSNHKSLCCYGGHSIGSEENSLQHPPSVLIGTPGRIDDHINRGNLDLSEVKQIVLDEFDKSLELGFEKEMKKIIERLDQLSNRTLTSATKMEEIPSYTGMQTHHEINFLSKTEPASIEMYELRSEGNDKLATLIELVKYVGNDNTIVFCNHRDAVDRISELLYEEGIAHERFHGGMQQLDRERALIKFRNQSLKILVTTDLAARGLDISTIKTVVHYQLPTVKESFVHRNGRTGRMGAQGQSILLLREEDHYPKYIEEKYQNFTLPAEIENPEQPKFVTLYIGAGKKDKVNKIDVVGLLCKKGGLEKSEIGQIDVLDRNIFVAVDRKRSNALLSKVRNEKIKKKKVKIAKAK